MRFPYNKAKEVAERFDKDFRKESQMIDRVYGGRLAKEHWESYNDGRDGNRPSQDYVDYHLGK